MVVSLEGAIKPFGLLDRFDSSNMSQVRCILVSQEMSTESTELIARASLKVIRSLALPPATASTVAALNRYRLTAFYELHA